MHMHSSTKTPALINNPCQLDVISYSVIEHFDSESIPIRLQFLTCNTTLYVTGFAEKGLPHTSNSPILTIHNLKIAVVAPTYNYMDG